MPANKSHHFVPRFYLRLFSTDPKKLSINLFNMKRERVVLNAALKHQCARDYLYGKEGDNESRLSTLEGAAAQVFERMIATQELPTLFTKAYFDLFIFTYTQYIRTGKAVDRMQDAASSFAKYLLSKQLPGEPIDKLTIGLRNPGAFFLEIGQRFFGLLLDLESRLLVAAPGTEFVASDNPAVFYNQLMEFDTVGSNTGAASRGLQIFFPVSPGLMLMFFDPAVYVVGARREVTYQVRERSDMLALNTLQLVAAQENVYFASGQSNLYQANEASRRYRRADLNRYHYGPEVDRPDGKTTQKFMFSGVETKTQLNLTFVRIQKPAKKWREDYRRLPAAARRLPRNADFVAAHDLAADDVQHDRISFADLLTRLFPYFFKR